MKAFLTFPLKAVFAFCLFLPSPHVLAEISQAELETALVAGMDKVEELRWIREKAQSLALQAYHDPMSYSPSQGVVSPLWIPGACEGANDISRW